jgi:hypothetical protein
MIAFVYCLLTNTHSSRHSADSCAFEFAGLMYKAIFLQMEMCVKIEHSLQCCNSDRSLSVTTISLPSQTY